MKEKEMVLNYVPAAPNTYLTVVHVSSASDDVAPTMADVWTEESLVIAWELETYPDNEPENRTTALPVFYDDTSSSAVYLLQGKDGKYIHPYVATYDNLEVAKQDILADKVAQWTGEQNRKRLKAEKEAKAK